MKPLKSFLLLLSIVSLAGVISCKKSDPTTLSKTQLLTIANGWIMTSLKVGGLETFSTLVACKKDDVIKFSTNGVATFLVNTKCDALESDTAGTWAFKNNETVITMTQNGISTDYSVIDLNTTTLKTMYSQTVSGTTVIAEITLAPK